MNNLAEFLASYTSDFPEAKPLLQEYEGLCSVNADLLRAAVSMMSTPCPQPVWQWLSDNGLAEQFTAAIAKAEGGGPRVVGYDWAGFPIVRHPDGSEIVEPGWEVRDLVEDGTFRGWDYNLYNVEGQVDRWSESPSEIYDALIELEKTIDGLQIFRSPVAQQQPDLHPYTVTEVSQRVSRSMLISLVAAENISETGGDA